MEIPRRIYPSPRDYVPPKYPSPRDYINPKYPSPATPPPTTLITASRLDLAECPSPFAPPAAPPAPQEAVGVSLPQLAIPAPPAPRETMGGPCRNWFRPTRRCQLSLLHQRQLECSPTAGVSSPPCTAAGRGTALVRPSQLPCPCRRFFLALHCRQRRNRLHRQQRPGCLHHSPRPSPAGPSFLSTATGGGGGSTPGGWRGRSCGPFGSSIPNCGASASACITPRCIASACRCAFVPIDFVPHASLPLPRGASGSGNGSAFTVHK
ncbi:unnamed protein product [Coccothraustes coccothraustes]